MDDKEKKEVVDLLAAWCCAHPFKACRSLCDTAGKMNHSAWRVLYELKKTDSDLAYLFLYVLERDAKSIGKKPANVLKEELDYISKHPPPA